MKKIPTVLLIMDGYGLGEENSANAAYTASTPNLDRLFETCPHTTLSASGLDVGLPEGQMGNSEVGHTNIGAGRVVFQDLPKISLAIADGSFFKNPQYLSAMLGAKQRGKTLHLCGLVSDGGVHSHTEHLFALIEMAKSLEVPRCCIHAFLDGRDVPPRSGADYIKMLQDKLRELSYGEIATVQGRFYAMDRDKRWERLQKAYDAMVHGEGVKCPDAHTAVLDSYSKDISDEFMLPTVCSENGSIKKGDSLIFFNFRPDRARELTWALTGNLPDGHEMQTQELSLDFVCTTQYDESLSLPIAFESEDIKNTFGEYISRLGLRQLRIAETEKYAHVTFFYNGGVEKVFPGEDRVLVPSPKDYPTYDLIPAMSALEVTDKCVERILSGEYDIVVCNLANCDMVGHTGVMSAAVQAVEVTDECVGRIVSAVKEMGGIALVTADHGNADSMRLPDGGPNTAHTTNPVPLIVCGANVKLRSGRLCDIAPTMLSLMGLEKPLEMTGNSLIIKEKSNETVC